MDSSRPLFVTSLARSGGNLTTMMLSVNKEIAIASDPYLELQRSLRNAIVRACAPPELAATLPPGAPMQDYYFSAQRIRLMDAIQGGDVRLPFDPAEWDVFLSRSQTRAALQCPELIPYLPGLRAATYREMFDHALRIILEARNLGPCKWVGIREAWTIELFAPLARAYPDAKFLVLLRDPRATINSMLGMKGADRELIAHSLSYARHWRKYVAFCLQYRRDPLFTDRLFVVTHEQVLEDAEVTARHLCDWLEVSYDPAMLDTNNYFDHGTGGVWKGNSSFEEVTSGISAHRATRWRTTLDPKVVKMVDFTCGPDMAMIGYAPETEAQSGWQEPDILDCILEDGRKPNCWRSDFEDPQQDYGFELFRRALLALNHGAVETEIVRRSFLFEAVFDELRSGTEGDILGSGRPA